MFSYYTVPSRGASETPLTLCGLVRSIRSLAMRFITSLCFVAALGLTAFTFPRPDGEGTITVTNNSSIALDEIYSSTCDEDEWGDDLMGVEVLEPGEEIDITVEVGCWDIKAVAEDGQEIDDYSITIEDGDELEWTVEDDDDDSDEEDDEEDDDEGDDEDDDDDDDEDPEDKN